MYLCNVFQSQSSNLAISAFDTFFSKSSTILLCFFANFLYVLPLGRPICFPSARTLFNDSLVLSEISWRSISLAREKAKASTYSVYLPQACNFLSKSIFDTLFQDNFVKFPLLQANFFPVGIIQLQ